MEQTVRETTKVNISNWQITKSFLEQWLKKPSYVNKNMDLPILSQ